jgi:hypothetical protein
MSKLLTLLCFNFSKVGGRSSLSFPLLHDHEDGICQPFFDQMFEDLRCHKVHRRLTAGGYSTKPAPKNQQPKFFNEFIRSPNSPTFST